MKTLMLSLFAIATPLFALNTAAGVTPPPVPQQQSVDVSDATVEKFATIYVEIQQLRQDMSEKMSTAASREDAQKLQKRLEEKTIDTIESHGWTLDRYNEVATAITTDEDLKRQAVETINEIASS